jgi:hypothetical protein
MVGRQAVWLGLAACGRIGFDASGGGVPHACPTGYLTVAELCVAKYEMKDVAGVATSTADGVPWVMLDLPSAIGACQAIGDGYDLIDNAHWQSLAQAIADEPSNWSSGAAYVGELAVGHSDSAPDHALAASTDDDPCAGTGQTCSQDVWDRQRRTHRLPDGQLIWDLGGNATEWVRDSVSPIPGGDDYVSMLAASDPRIAVLGTPDLCDAPTVSPFCGYGILHTKGGATTVRGGGLDWDADAGIFSCALFFPADHVDWNISFRCVFTP